MKQQVFFYSEQSKISASLYLPKNHSSEKKYPALHREVRIVTFYQEKSKFLVFARSLRGGFRL